MKWPQDLASLLGRVQIRVLCVSVCTMQGCIRVCCVLCGVWCVVGALCRAFKWDEERFGREYDLDLFNVVAVSDFNCGAMENKSLNIFNDRYILADNKTATDDDFSNVLGVVGHEYFHNWTGNRVTCRDWYEKYAGRLPARPAGYIQGCPAICG